MRQTLVLSLIFMFMLVLKILFSKITVDWPVLYRFIIPSVVVWCFCMNCVAMAMRIQRSDYHDNCLK